jgi:hypothetical protein
MQRLCKHASTATNTYDLTTDTHATTEELLEVVFPVGSMQRVYQDSLQAVFSHFEPELL